MLVFRIVCFISSKCSCEMFGNDGKVLQNDSGEAHKKAFHCLPRGPGPSRMICLASFNKSASESPTRRSSHEAIRKNFSSSWIIYWTWSRLSGGHWETRKRNFAKCIGRVYKLIITTNAACISEFWEFLTSNINLGHSSAKYWQFSVSNKTNHIEGDNGSKWLDITKMRQILTATKDQMTCEYLWIDHQSSLHHP